MSPRVDVFVVACVAIACITRAAAFGSALQWIGVEGHTVVGWGIGGEVKVGRMGEGVVVGNRKRRQHGRTIHRKRDTRGMRKGGGGVYEGMGNGRHLRWSEVKGSRGAWRGGGCID